VSRKQEWLDTYVTDVIIERLSQPDELDVFSVDDTDDIHAAQRALAALRAELTELRQAKKAGQISLSSFLAFEPDLLAKIDDAQQRSAAAAGVPPLLVDTAGPDVRDGGQRSPCPNDVRSSGRYAPSTSTEPAKEPAASTRRLSRSPGATATRSVRPS
jgi:hypothetical protein